MSNSVKRNLLLVGVSFLAILLWLIYKRERLNDQAGLSHALTSAQPEQTLQNSKNPPPVVPIPTTSNASSIQQLSRAEKLAAAYEDQNVPVHFWGRVVDSVDKPMAGVKIKAHVRYWSAALPTLSGSRKFEVSSGSDGRFEIGNTRGDVLEIESMEKEGYEPEPGALRGYGFNQSENVKTSQEAPVTLRMWKAGKNMDLVDGRKFFAITPDGSECVIDLVKGVVSESSNKNGDLMVWLKRPADVHYGQRYDWSFGIRAIDGGMAREADQYSSMYLAPLNGCTNSYRDEITKSGEGWGDASGITRWYIQTRHGKVFGRIEVQFFADYGGSGEGRVLVNYAVNTSGKRNLKP